MPCALEHDVVCVVKTIQKLLLVRQDDLIAEELQATLLMIGRVVEARQVWCPSRGFIVFLLRLSSYLHIKLTSVLRYYQIIIEITSSGRNGRMQSEIRDSVTVYRVSSSTNSLSLQVLNGIMPVCKFELRNYSLLLL